MMNQHKNSHRSNRYFSNRNNIYRNDDQSKGSGSAFGIVSRRNSNRRQRQRPMNASNLNPTYKTQIALSYSGLTANHNPSVLEAAIKNMEKECKNNPTRAVF